jgi:hypothetical protein
MNLGINKERGANEGMMDNDHKKRAAALEYAANSWTLTPSIASLATGAVAVSIALISFGLTGIPDFVSTVIVVRQHLREQKVQLQGEINSAGGRKSLFMVGTTFFFLRCISCTNQDHGFISGNGRQQARGGLFRLRCQLSSWRFS